MVNRPILLFKNANHCVVSQCCSPIVKHITGLKITIILWPQTGFHHKCRDTPNGKVNKVKHTHSRFSENPLFICASEQPDEIHGVRSMFTYTCHI